MKELELTEAEKKLAAELAQIAVATDSDDFWNNVGAEAQRLTKNPEIKPRQGSADR